MNGRMKDAKTPWRRLAVAYVSHMVKIRNDFRKTSSGPELADYEDTSYVLELYVRRELVLARIDEARKASGAALTKRIQELAEELAEIERQLPEQDRL